MKEFRLKRLEKFRTGGTQHQPVFHMPVPASKTGKVLRYCPNGACAPRRFQIANEAAAGSIAPEHEPFLRRAPGSAGTTCPYCGTDAGDSEFNAPEDIDHLKGEVVWAAQEELADLVENMAKGHNNPSRGRGFVSIKMDFKRGHNPRPVAWREDLLRDLTCCFCGRRYGVYAIGLFCPDCGGRNLSTHFNRELELIAGQIDIAEQSQANGEPELAYRLLGNAHEDVVTAFESYLKTAFAFACMRRFGHELPADIMKQSKGNPFQRIDRTGRLFAHLEVSPFRELTEVDLGVVRVNIEKRHIVGHNLSMADTRFLEESADTPLGETVVLIADEIQEFAAICGRVIGTVERDLRELLPPDSFTDESVRGEAGRLEA